MYLGPLVSYVDRFALPPLLLSVARDLDHSLVTASILATFYFFAYGLMQLFWGLLSDRVGRVGVMRWALAGMAVADVVAAAAPSLSVLMVAKAAAGALAAALLPAAMVYVADAVPFDRRQQVIANSVPFASGLRWPFVGSSSHCPTALPAGVLRVAWTLPSATSFPRRTS